MLTLFLCLDFDLSPHQSTQNILRVKSSSKVSFAILYEESQTGINLDKEKFLHQATVFLDLEGNSVKDLSTIISSPNYPNPYPNSADVTWFVRAPEQYIISMTIKDLFIEECCDRLTVYDGSSSQSPILNDLKGGSVPETAIVSSSSNVQIRFSSDCSLTERGFLALLRPVLRRNNTTEDTTTPNWISGRPNDILTTTNSINNYPACSEYGDHLHINNNGNDFFESPNYPNNYYRNANCSWFIHGWYDAVRLVSDDISISYGDKLVVHDGSSSQYPVLRRISGAFYGSVMVQSTGPNMFITFETDGYYESRGFRFRYEAVHSTDSITRSTPSEDETTLSSLTCSGTSYEQASRYSWNRIQSPGYPNGYGTYLSCSWLIQSGYYGDHINLNVEFLRTESGGDYLRIYDGSDSRYPLIASLSGYVSLRTYYSTGQELYLRFSSNGYTSSSQQTGFSVTFLSAVPDSENAQYTTEIPIAETQTLPTSCNGVQYLTASFSIRHISSPGYPYSYSNNLQCSWSISTSYYGYVIQLNVLDLDLETCCDYVDIYDGPSTSYSKIIRLTDQRNEVVLSSNRNMYLRFSTDSSVTRKGFEFSYTSATLPTALDSTTNSNDHNSTCNEDGEHLHINNNRNDYFESPNYPSNYYRNMNCSWFIQGWYDENNKVLLKSDDFYLSYGDKLVVYDGSSSLYPVLRTIYGSYGSSVVVQSTGPNMFITFETDDYYEGRGFRFRYEEVNDNSPTTLPPFDETTVYWPTCSGTSHEQASRYSRRYIQSPGYPNGYDRYLSCSWLIQSGYYGDHISFTMETMSTESGGDYLRLYDGWDSGYRQIAALSGRVNQKTYYSTGQQMYVHFTSNGYTSSSEQTGFSFSFMSTISSTSEAAQQTTEFPFPETQTAGATCPYLYLYADANRAYLLSSLGYPDTQPANLNCYWRIFVSSYGYVVQLSIVDIDLYYPYDIIQIYDGYDSSAPLLRTFNSNSYSIVYSSGNYMFVSYRTEPVSHSSHRGFQAAYVSLYHGNCFAEDASQNATATKQPEKPN